MKKNLAPNKEVDQTALTYNVSSFSITKAVCLRENVKKISSLKVKK